MSWYDWLAPVLQIGSTIFNANSNINANDRIAQTSNQATQAAAAAKAEAQRAAQAQYGVEEQKLQELQSSAAPALSKVNQLINRNPGLTPAQQMALDEARRQSMNSLVAGGMAGDGRALTAGVRNIEDNMRANFIDANQQASNQAATGLAGQYYTTGTAAANVNNNIAKSLVDTGTDAASAINDVGQTNAKNIMSNQNQTTASAGTALNDIVGAITAQQKANALRNNNDGQYTGLNKKPQNSNL